MPSTDALTGFILKKEACATYNRSFRQLARDFDKAATRGDKTFVENFKLSLEDGTNLEASEVTKEKIQKLRDKGLNPTWFVRESWMRDKYGLRKSAGEEQPPSSKVEPAEKESPTASDLGTSESSAVIQSKDDLIEVLRDENRFLRESLGKETERRSEDKQLTRELHILLKNMQDRLLPAPTTESRGVMGAVPAATPTTPSDSESKTVQPPSTRPKAKRKRASAKPKSTPTTSPKKPKWYELPTFKRYLSRSAK